MKRLSGLLVFLFSQCVFTRLPILHFPDNSRAASRHRVAMKDLVLLFSLTIAVGVAMAADPLTEAFQRRLLAEESQRDLKAAAAAYDEVVRQADSQRELVATALFRRAEVQRRLGRTTRRRPTIVVCCTIFLTGPICWNSPVFACPSRLK